jgi:Ca-activated chloride channel homolog
VRIAEPAFIFLIIPVVVFVFLYLSGLAGKEASIRFSSMDLVETAGARRTTGRRMLCGLMRAAVLLLMVIALCRPQTGYGERQETKFVVDVMIALDTSSSMATLDFHPDNRLTAAKIEARRFTESRPHDRVGLVVFAKNGITQCPLTTDKAALIYLLNNVDLGMLEDGTAIGVGLATAVNRLRESEAKSKVVILLTDGVNNSGEIDPITAARIAKEYGVRVYTIGMGVDGEALLPVNDPNFGRRLVRVQTEIDEKTLREISDLTGGLYFRAKDEKALRQIFKEIDNLEKTEIQVDQYTRYEDHYPWFLWAAFVVLMIELIFTRFLFIRIP